MFALDRDLLALEPTLLRDVGFAGQTLARVTGSVSSGTLTISGADLSALKVDAGSIFSIDGVPMEVIARSSSTTASVSLVRGSTDDPVIVPGNLATKTVVIVTFKPQIAQVHDQLLRLIGIEPGLSSTTLGEEALNESMIVNPQGFRLIECLGALHLIYSAASGLTGEKSPGGVRARMYRERFAAERGRVTALLDRDGDGVAESRRSLSMIRLVRA